MYISYLGSSSWITKYTFILLLEGKRGVGVTISKKKLSDLWSSIVIRKHDFRKIIELALQEKLDT